MSEPTTVRIGWRRWRLGAWYADASDAQQLGPMQLIGLDGALVRFVCRDGRPHLALVSDWLRWAGEEVQEPDGG